MDRIQEEIRIEASYLFTNANGEDYIEGEKKVEQMNLTNPFQKRMTSETRNIILFQGNFHKKVAGHLGTPPNLGETQSGLLEI